MIDNQSIAVNAFARHMLTSLSVDEILLPRYVNLSINFRGLLLRVNMVPYHLKQMNSVLFVFMKRPMPPTFALGYVAGILLGQVYLQEALDHLHLF